MNNDIYSGSIDWDEIYRTFHDVPAASNNLLTLIQKSSVKKILIAGFPQIASELASYFDTQWVEFSAPIAQMAVEKFSNLSSVEVADILDVLQRDDADVVAIVCRISAYWTSSAEFERLVQGLKRHQRAIVAIDFFDREMIDTQSVFHFGSSGSEGSWEVLDIDSSRNSSPQIYDVKLRVRYTLADQLIDYEGTRSFYDRSDCLKYFNHVLPDAKIEVLPPLIPGDPSFTIYVHHSDISADGIC